MPVRLKLILAYDGAPFAGWQSQPNRNGVQDHVEAALARIAGEPVRVHGAGRTDAGVHALAQCAHAEVAPRRHTAGKWAAALNGVLPPTIRVLRASFAGSSFHARFSAKGKRYRYRIWNAEVLPPSELGRAWHVRRPLDLTAMQAAAKHLVGRHDFAPFAANRGSPVEDTVRLLSHARVARAGRLITIELEADGFLYKMVRLIVGSLAQVGAGTVGPQEIRDRLRDPQLSFGSNRNAAPASGLFLIRVRY